jgi:phosphatidylglycerophosphate synthase
MNAANFITLLRLIATPLFATSVMYAERGGSGTAAALCFTVAALTDFVDGRVARRMHTASPAGRVLDHAADILFLLTALTTFVALGAAPWWVPASIAAAFGFYVVDSLRRSARPQLVGSRIGHLGGIANYVLVGVLTFNDSVGLRWISPALMQALFAAVPIYSGWSIVSRLRAPATIPC